MTLLVTWVQRGVAWVWVTEQVFMNQSHMVTLDHGCDLTDGTKNDAPRENCLAILPLPALLPSNWCGALLEEDDQCWWIARAILAAQRPKAHNLSFCETCIELIV